MNLFSKSNGRIWSEKPKKKNSGNSRRYDLFNAVHYRG
jgi:hypothetical protein